MTPDRPFVDGGFGLPAQGRPVSLGLFGRARNVRLKVPPDPYGARHSAVGGEPAQQVGQQRIRRTGQRSSVSSVQSSPGARRERDRDASSCPLQLERPLCCTHARSTLVELPPRRRDRLVQLMVALPSTGTCRRPEPCRQVMPRTLRAVPGPVHRKDLVVGLFASPAFGGVDDVAIGGRAADQEDTAVFAGPTPFTALRSGSINASPQAAQSSWRGVRA